jgi:capsular polysaccharide export protein
MRQRRYLLLQGPASPFLKKLAEALENKGAEVVKINLSLGDVAFWWPRKSELFREKPDLWDVYLDRYIIDQNVTDIVMLGDGRAPHHRAAAVASASGVDVHILEHGYLRPDWLTIEPDGMSAHSRFPQDAERIRQIAASAPPVDKGGKYRSSFLTYALYDLIYHVPNVLLGWLVHPHYRTHGPVHPVREYAGWIWKALRIKSRRREADRAINGALAPIQTADSERPPRVFLFPLQLPGDYQIIRHAPGGDLFAIVDKVIASFAHHARSDDRLLFKVHPIDNGLSRWPERISAASDRYAVSERIFYADGGDTDDLISRSTGVVTVNSTVGLTALSMGKPVIALGAAVYDIPGLTFQKALAEFWQDPGLPDKALFDAFQRALAATTQVRGGFIGKDAIEAGAENVATQLMEREPRLPKSWAKPRGEKHFRYEDELFAK